MSDWRALDPSKLMIVPILYFAILTLLDRAAYEAGRAIDPDMPERMTRL